MSKNYKHQLTAIIKDKKGKILSIGKNSYIKTHPVMYKLALEKGIFEPKANFVHAEIDAINRCKNLNKAYKIEVYRLSRNGKYMNSKPCHICRSGILKTNIKVIGYFENNIYVEEKI